jgi:cytochrome c oxidase subunit 2
LPARTRSSCFILAAALTVAGCGKNQSTLKPHSHASREVAHLWWGMLIGSAVVFGVVCVALLAALLRGRAQERPQRSDSRRARGVVLVGGFAVPLAVLVTLFVLTLETLPAVSAPKPGTTRLTVEVTGKQWFWVARYVGTRAVTANEIHIPAGERVRIVARSDDVIHSLWVPELNRKIDMIPGRTSSILLQADPGTYRGQCAEFCGLQHANMAFLVVAEPPARFRAWLARQARPARRPATAAERRGERVFDQAGCSGCHTIRGTDASAKVGPDLTHLAARRTLAAVTIPNAKGYLAGWILDPQHVKPGNKMPGLDLRGDQLQSVLAYLQSLK